MKILHNSVFAVSTAALLSFDSLFLGVDGATWTEFLVKCHKKAPELCVGLTYYTTPIPAAICDADNNCETVYMGGYGYNFNFVEGLEEGLDDGNQIDDALTGLSTNVHIDDDEINCTVKIGDEECKKCSAKGCGDMEVKFDCTNLEKGIKSKRKCVSFDPFLYPLEGGEVLQTTPNVFEFLRFHWSKATDISV